MAIYWDVVIGDLANESRDIGKVLEKLLLKGSKLDFEGGDGIALDGEVAGDEQGGGDEVGLEAALALLGEMAGVLGLSRAIGDPKQSAELLSGKRKALAI